MEHTPESLFAGHLAVLTGSDDKATETAAFEVLLAEHPEHAETLKLLRVDHGEARGLLQRVREQTERSQPAEGKTIGDFRLVRRLGRGGMGEVWEAEQVSLSRRVALKLLPPERMNEKGLDFFAREARAGARLNHPGIIAVLGTGEDEGTRWIAMELAEGGCTLAGFLEDARGETELPEGYYQSVAELSAKVADAVSAAHEAGVIHRDLKPQNVLITEGDEPKVADFGLARLVDEHSLSRTGDFAGTYYYMSPEQVAAKRIGLDHRTDIFSLGVLLYELLTLTRPFEGDTTHQIAHKILMYDPPDPLTLRSRVPVELAVICAKAMEKDPDHRYPTMAELAADLRRHLANEPILARAPGTLARMGKWARRNPTKSVAGAVATVAFVTISGLAWQLQQRGLELKETNEELKQVSDFQAQQLSGVDAGAMGLTIRSMVLERARDAGEAANRGEEALDQEQVALEKLLAGADFTGLALSVLDKEVFMRAMQELEEFSNKSMVQAQLLQTVATTLRELGRLELAQEPQEKALAIRRRELGDEDPDTLHSIGGLGMLFLEQGKLEEAEPLLREAMEGCRRTLGDEHRETLDAINNLGILLNTRAKLDEAELLIREALDGCRRTLGNEDRDTLGSILNLGAVLYTQGKIKEVEPLFREATEGFRRTLGDEHPDTLTAINNLGILLFSLGRLEEAELLWSEALEVRRRVLGEWHPSTLESSSALGALLYRQDKFDQAESLWRKTLELRRRLLGDTHSKTLDSINNMGVLLYAQEKLDEAEPLWREAVVGYRHVKNDLHLKTLNSIRNLGRLLHSQGKIDDAEPLLREALEGYRSTYGDEHAETLKSKELLDALLSERDGSQTPPEEARTTDSPTAEGGGDDR